MCKRLFFSMAAAALLCTALAITSCHSGGSDSEANAATAPTARVAVAQRGDIAHVLTLAGQFQPYQVVDVHPKVSGYMKRINVDIGDIVHQGRDIGSSRSAGAEGAIGANGLRAQAKPGRDHARPTRDKTCRGAELRSPRAVGTRLQQAAATRPGLIAQQELDDAQAKDLSSQAQIDAAKSAMAAAQQHAEAARSDNERYQALEDYTNVTAPIAGVVIWRYADTGALIQGGTNSNNQALPIVRLSQSSLLRLRVPVPENDVQYVHDGRPARSARRRHQSLVLRQDCALHARCEL